MAVVRDHLMVSAKVRLGHMTEEFSPNYPRILCMFWCRCWYWGALRNPFPC